jgi:hypothetical protein
MPANMHFLRKLAYDELKETLFFATGEVPSREKTEKVWTVKAGEYVVNIFHNRNITVNGDRCKSVPEAKFVIQDLLV